MHPLSKHLTGFPSGSECLCQSCSRSRPGVEVPNNEIGGVVGIKLDATKVSFCCVSIGLGTYFSGVMPVDSKAAGDVMLHFSGEAALTKIPKSLLLRLAVSRR
jgi:hypothetical protein